MKRGSYPALVSNRADAWRASPVVHQTVQPQCSPLPLRLLSTVCLAHLRLELRVPSSFQDSPYLGGSNPHFCCRQELI